MKNLLWLSLIFCIVFLGSIELNLFGIDSLQKNNIKFEENEEKFELEDKLHTSTDFFSGIGKALNTTEYGNGHFPNYNLNSTNNDEASIIVPDGWEANEIAGNIFQIYDYDSYFLNDTFDLEYDSNRWTNDTNSDYVSFGWYDAPSGTNDSIYMRFDESGSAWTNKYAYWNHTLSVPREYIDFENWEISFNYRVLYTTAEWLPGASSAHNLRVDVDAASQEFTICKLEEGVNLQNNTWHSASFVFQPELYNFQLPGTISLIFLVDYKNSPANPTGHFEMYYDNVTLKLSTTPKPSQINLTITDITNDDLKIITDTGQYGEGIFDLQNNWKGGRGGLYHNFSFSHNSSGNVIISTDLYSYASSEKKTTTLLGLEGCEYVVENNSMVGWTTYFAVNRPGSYSTDYYFNITKPLNWVITAVIDPYLNNRVDDVFGTGYGNTTISIPNNIITNGAWKIVAEAPNYLIEADIFKKNDQEWMKNSSFYPSEKLKINATASTELITTPELTNAYLTIFYPNGTIFHQENASVSIDGTFEFSEITLGQKNATVGTYSAFVKWSESVANMTQVGFYQLNFKVFHLTSLTPVKSYFEQTAGEPLLIKINFTDDNFNTPVDYAEVKYISSFDSYGMMAYIGSGIYSSEIDTNGLPTGDYYFSINASKHYYENHTTSDLIHLKLTAQPLKLVFPSRLLNSTGNDHIIFEFNLEGEISGAPVPGADIITDWMKNYTWHDYENGTYALNFSTYGLPLEGVVEAFEVEIFANKSNYKSVADYMTILVHPIITVANANQTNIFGFLNEDFEVKVNYTEKNGELISGAECTVTWESSYEVTPVSDGFIIKYHTINLDINVYNSLVRFSKPGYENALVSITIGLTGQQIILEVKVNGEEIAQNHLVETSYNNFTSLSCKALAEVEDIYLTGASIKLIIDDYEIELLESPNYWYNKTFTISTDIFSLGINYVYLKFELANYTTTTFSFQIQVKQIDLIVQTINFIDTISAYVGDSISIRINLTEHGSNEPIENATIYCYWRYGSYYFSEIEEGIYKLDLDLSQTDTGTHRFYLVITTEETVYKVTEQSFLIIISERELPNYLLNVIIIGLIAVAGVLGALSVRSYVILPRKRRRDLAIAEKTQPYKDIRNVEAIICSSKSSGLSIYNKTFSIIDEEYITGFSGFIQAITILEKQYTKKGTKKGEIESISEESEGDDVEIKELDFNFFNSLICDYKNLRIILVLRELSSERLRNNLKSVTRELYSQCEETINQFKGNLSGISQKVEAILYKHLPLYYKEEFVLNKGTHYHSIKVSGELSNLEIRILHILEAQSKFKPQFLLENILSMVENVAENKKIIAIESIIEKGMIKSVS